MFATRTRGHDKIIGQQYLEHCIEKNSEETARRMLYDGLSIDIIAKYTGLSEEAIQELKGK